MLGFLWEDGKQAVRHQALVITLIYTADAPPIGPKTVIEATQQRGSLSGPECRFRLWCWRDISVVGIDTFADVPLEYSDDEK